MKMIIGGRQSGKTTKLLIQANDNQSGIIIVPNINSLRNIKRLGSKMGMNVHKMSIMTLRDFNNLDSVCRGGNNLYIDNFEEVLRLIFHKHSIKSIVLDSEE